MVRIVSLLSDNSLSESSANSSHQITSAILQGNNSVTCRVNEEFVEAKGAPKKIRDIALNEDGLWCISRKGRGYRWNTNAESSRWLKQPSIKRAASLFVCQDGALGFVDWNGEFVFPFDESADDRHELVQWMQGNTARLRSTWRAKRIAGMTLRWLTIAAIALACLSALHMISLSRAENLAIQKWDINPASLVYSHQFDEGGKFDQYLEPLGPEWLWQMLGGNPRTHVVGIRAAPRRIAFTPVVNVEAMSSFPYMRDIVAGITSVDQAPEVREHFRDLLLRGHSIEPPVDLSPIGKLKRLEHVCIEGSFLELSPLLALPRLQSLDLARAEVRDMSAIGEMKQLRKLELSTFYTEIGCLDGLAELTDLEAKCKTTPPEQDELSKLSSLKRLELICDGNPNFEVIGKLESLETLLIRGNTELPDLQWLSGLTNLRRLEIDTDRDSNIAEGISVDVLTNLKELRHLELPKGIIFDLGIMDSLPNLKLSEVCLNHRCIRTLERLSLTGTNATSLEGFREVLPNLNRCDISDCQIADLGFLKYCDKLKVLVIDDTPIRDLAPIQGLTNLVELSAKSCEIENFECIAKLKSLNKLSLTNSNVRDLRFVEDLKLEELDISYSAVADLSPLKGQPIESLDVSSSKVTDIAPLRHLAFLSELNLADTWVTDVTVLETLNTLYKLDLTNVPVADPTTIKYLRREVSHLLLPSGERTRDAY